MAFGVMGGQYQATHADPERSTGPRPRHPAILGRAAQLRFDGTLSLEPTVPGSVADDLIARGHCVTWADEPLGGFQAVQIDAISGVMYGASDHRKDGIALAA